MSKEYAIYDITNYEECVYFGTIKDCAKYLDCKESSLRSYLTKKKYGFLLLKHKYELAEIKCDYDDEERKIRKTDKEIFQQLINAFKEEKVELKIYDSFKFTIERSKNRVMEYEEEWKPIPQFNYSISNYGRIRNEKNGKIKSPRLHRWIVQTDIYKDGKRFTIDVPRLEAKLFIRDLSKEEKVFHIDGDSLNNYYKNFKIVNKEDKR